MQRKHLPCILIRDYANIGLYMFCLIRGSLIAFIENPSPRHAKTTPRLNNVDGANIKRVVRAVTKSVVNLSILISQYIR